MPPSSPTVPRTVASRTAGVAGLALLVLALYGAHLGDGYLADDFLYLSWLAKGWGELLRRVTVDSDPRMIRPLPALAWSLAGLPGGAAWQHGLSLLAHLLCGGLVARLAGRGSRQLGWLLGALFLSFPLFTEPVIWLSAAPDLWAAVFALAALDAGLRESPTRQDFAAAAALFLLSLLCKESALLLPLVVFCFGPWRRRRRLAAVLGSVAAVYLAVRLVLFHGLGGYLDATGRPLALQIDPLLFLRNLALQLPYRVLIPLKRAGELAAPLAAVSAVLALAAVAAGRIWRRPCQLLAALAALVAALLPVAAFFSVDVDHENSRLLYFPLAVFTAAAGAALPKPAPATRWALAATITLWSFATLANGRAWSDGSREVGRTLAAMRALEERFPDGATVLVAGHDTWRGAYVWRNGLAFAARRAELRADLDWRLGTAALAANRALLGGRVFEIGLDGEGRPRDWTACQRALHTDLPKILGHRRLAAASRAAGHRGAGRLDTGPIPLTLPAAAVAVEILATPGGGRRDLEARLFWRRRDGARFNVTESRRFHVFAGPPGRSIVRLPAAESPFEELELRLEVTPDAVVDLLAGVRIVELPAICR